MRTRLGWRNGKAHDHDDSGWCCGVVSDLPREWLWRGEASSNELVPKKTKIPIVMMFTYKTLISLSKSTFKYVQVVFFDSKI